MNHNDIFWISGVSHADELIYLFIYPFQSIPPGLNASETDHSMKMLQVWTNFVKFGYKISLFF
jgi:hypothetical protein